MCIHQFHYATAAGDAVTNQMRFIRDSLREAGVTGEIFARENKAPAEYGIRAFLPEALWNADLILVHHSHGNPALSSLLRIEIPQALIYHNVTPARFFQHDPYIARLCELGRRQLKEFRDAVVATFAVSRYNARELEALGFPEPRLFPLFHLESLPAARRPRPKRAKSAAPGTPLELLFVGKLAPHKNQALLIETLYYLHRAFPGKYRLVLVGREDPIYGDYLRQLARALRVEGHVRFTGRVSQEELTHAYESAAAYVSTSRHEGFGVPLVEAMLHAIPVLALPSSGVKETLGLAGVRLETRLPHRIAEIVDTVLERPAACRQILRGQATRLRVLKQFHNRQRVQSLLIDLVHDLRHPLQPRDFATERAPSGLVDL
jgi:glycosyltransferase involved in cell wall biosynthesis